MRLLLLFLMAVVQATPAQGERVDSIALGEVLRTESAVVATEGLDIDLWGTRIETDDDPLLVVEREARRELGPRVTLAEVSRRKSLSITEIRFVQLIDGIEVIHGDGVIRVDHGGRVTGLNLSLARPGRPSTDLKRLNEESPETDGSTALRWYNVGGSAKPAIEITTGIGTRLRRRIVVDGSEVENEALYYTKAARIFRSNPVTELNDPTLTDQNDAAAAVPDQAYSIVELDGGESLRLENARVGISPLSDPDTVHVDPSSPDFLFDRSMPQFEEVMAFYHLNKSLEYVETLGFTGTTQAVTKQVLVDAHGSEGADNSFYSKQSSGTPTLSFGDGGVDDAEDPDILHHELGHVIHDGLAPSALSGGSSTESRAMSEGFCDYWAFSQGWTASIESGRDPFCIGDWDARCGSGSSERCSYPAGADCLRRVDSQSTMSSFRRDGGSGTEHENGRIWSSALREIFLSLTDILGTENGRRVADRLVLDAMTGLPFRADFADAANRLIEVDQALNTGSARLLICGALNSRGIEASGCPDDFNGRFTYTVEGARDLVLPDGAVMRSTQFVPDEGIISELRVRLEVEQSPESRVIARLISPDGFMVRLTSEQGWKGPLSGVFGRNMPSSEPLNRFNGHLAGGLWTLELEARGTGAVLTDWSPGVSVENTISVNRDAAGALVALIPAVASADGAFGTRYVTDLSLFNQTTSEQQIYLVYTPATDPSEARIVGLRIVPRATVILRDIVEGFFDTVGVGALEIRGARGAVLATSRTYNNSPAGTFGQSIGSFADSLPAAGRKVFVPGLRENGQYRSNIGFFSASAEPVIIRVDLLDETGVVFGTRLIELEGWQQMQIAAGSLAGVEGFHIGTAAISLIEGGGVVAAYGSVIDNRTGDSIYIPAGEVPYAENRVSIPVVAHLDGGGGTRWRSDVTVFNPTDEVHETTMTFRPARGGEPITTHFSIGPGESRFMEDVLMSVFGVSDGSGQIIFADGTLLPSSRTWNDSATGTFGQFIGPGYLADTVNTDHPRGYAVGAIVSDGFRTNVGLTESTGEFAVFELEVLDRFGGTACRKVVGLGPWDAWQTSLSSMGCRKVSGGTLRVSHASGSGRALGFLSVIDNSTGDPVFIPVKATEAP